MAAPVLVVEYTTDDPADTTPTWTDVTDLVRSFSTNRGRDSERSLVEAGTAQILLSNRARDFDPTNDATLRPMNRWRISAVIDSGTEEIFVGYAESYDQQWPAVGRDAVTLVSCVDEMKVLSLDALPATDPPRDSYQDLVMYDSPSAYWPLLWPNVLGAAVGDDLASGSYASVTGSGAILGQIDPGYIYLSSTDYIATNPVNFGASFDLTGNSEFAIEAWISIDGGSAGETLIRGPLDNLGNITWRLALDTNEQLVLYARNSGGTTYTVTSTSVLTQGSIGPSNVWYHVVGTIDGGNLRLYVNGTQEASTAWTGVFQQIEGLGSNAFFAIGNLGVSIGSSVRAFDEVAFYKFGLSSTRIGAHYTAGTARGYSSQETDVRAAAVLADSSSTAATNLNGSGGLDMTPEYMTGQSPLEALRQAELAEQGLFYIARDGTITLLQVTFQGIPPWSDVGAVFDDDGDNLPYQDITVDYSDSFLFNEINVTRVGGLTQTRSDSTSIANYFKRSLSITDLPIMLDGDADGIAQYLLAEYKDPVARVTQLELLATEEVAEAVLPLDLGYTIRVVRTQPGGGSIDRTLTIQRIAVSGVPGSPWRITLGTFSGGESFVVSEGFRGLLALMGTG